jgi:hypothetical protein
MPPIEPPITGEQLLDAEMVDQAHLCVHHVADGDDGKSSPHGLPRLRVDAGRAPSSPYSRR